MTMGVGSFCGDLLKTHNLSSSTQCSCRKILIQTWGSPLTPSLLFRCFIPLGRSPLNQREIVVVNLKALVISISFEHYVIHEFWSLVSLAYDSILRFYSQNHSQYCIVYPHTYDSFFQALSSRIGILNLHALAHSFIGRSCSRNYNNQAMIDSHDCHPVTLTDMKWFTWLTK